MRLSSSSKALLARSTPDSFASPEAETRTKRVWGEPSQVRKDPNQDLT